MVVLFGRMIAATYSYGQKYEPFVPGEEMHMTVYYNWGFIWVHAGDADFRTDSLTFNKKSCIRINATGTSLRRWSFIFTLLDHYQSIVDLNGFKPLHYEKNTMEGGYWIHNIYDFDWKKKHLAVFTESKRFPAKDTSYQLKHPLFDVLTATYYLRTINTDSLQTGDTINIPVISDGEFDTYHIVYAGMGSLRKKNEILPCHVYKAVIAKSTFFSKTDPLVVFVSDDTRRLPVYVEANIIVGSVKVFLNPYRGFKVQKKDQTSR